MRPLPFSSTYAHPDDLLPLHLERVAQRASASIAPSARSEVRLIAFLAGLFHDIGKATPYFQDYLLRTGRRTRLTPHAKSGAVLSWWYSGELKLALWVRLAVFIAVLRHHGALNYDSWRQSLERVRCDLEDENDPLVEQLASMDLEGIRYWLGEVAERNGAIFGLSAVRESLTVGHIKNALSDRSNASRSKLRRAFSDLDDGLMFLAGFGGLLTVDKIDAAIQGREIDRQLIPGEAVAVFMKEYHEHAVPSPLDERRTCIAAEVKHTWLNHINDQLLALTAPTGSGKTLTIMNAALALRYEIEQTQGYSPRIIYCLPFTSVIDQNHSVLDSVLRANGLGGREDILLKHHHLADGVFRTAEMEHLPDGAGQLLTETWQSEIVVTTFHQMLHALLSNRNTSLKRAGQLSGSIVLMDEVQAIPLCYWEGLRHLFQSAARVLGTRFVLLTATRPLIFRPQDAQELLPSHEEHFKALARVRLLCHHHTPITLDEFTDRLIGGMDTDASMLVILNRRRAVRFVFTRIHESFPDKRLIALSTDLTPKDRRARIRLIRRLQRQGKPCIVISTQLVEAGVDVSFPIVHRDLAPLDSIIQSAGRCNRHAAVKDVGEVHLWAIHADKPDGGMGKPLWQRIYDSSLIEATREVLGHRPEWHESDFLTLSQCYFEECWRHQEQARMDEWLAQGDFERLQREFMLIPDGPPTSLLFVVTRPSDIALWERYVAIQANEDLTPVLKDREFRKIRHNFFERVIQIYAPPEPDNPITKLEAGSESYTRQTGFVAQPQDIPACIL